MIISSKITHIGSYAPEKKVSNQYLEDLINSKINLMRPGLIYEKFGLKERRFARADEQASDLAVAAALKILTPDNLETIDCLIFAAGSSDMIEPATASIVQGKLNLNCPAFDVKNACNSFVCGLQTANALIVSNTYKKILVVTGEKLSAIIKLEYEDHIEFLKRFASLSMGDAGAAAIVEASTDESGMKAQRFQTNGKYWDLCTVPGGGSMHPHDGSKVYFEGRTAEMRNIFLEKKGNLILETLHDANWTKDEIDFVFMHHVSASTFQDVADDLNIALPKIYSVFENFGNMASASIPFAMSDALDKGLLKKGDKVMLLGLASGISISVQLLIW